MTEQQPTMTGCAWRPGAWDVIGKACPECGHIDVVHALPTDPVDHPGCVVCRLEATIPKPTTSAELRFAAAVLAGLGMGVHFDLTDIRWDPDEVADDLERMADGSNR